MVLKVISRLPENNIPTCIKEHDSRQSVSANFHLPVHGYKTISGFASASGQVRCLHISGAKQITI